jgi:hypothetical protein
LDLLIQIDNEYKVDNVFSDFLTLFVEPQGDEQEKAEDTLHFITLDCNKLKFLTAQLTIFYHCGKGKT